MSELPHYASAVLDLGEGDALTRVMCYPITHLMLIERGRREVRHAFSVDADGRWYERGPLPRDVEEPEPSVWMVMLNRDDGSTRLTRCPLGTLVKRVMLLPVWDPSTPQMAFKPDEDGRWIEWVAKW